MPPETGLLLVAGALALVVFDARFGQLDESMPPGGRPRLILRAATEAVTLAGLAAPTALALAGLVLAATSLAATLAADIAAGRMQEAELRRAGAEAHWRETTAAIRHAPPRTAFLALAA